MDDFRLEILVHYFLPFPTKYVLLPWRVKGPGLSPRILVTRGLSWLSFGIWDRDVAVILRN